jgi:pimeloyl-ACP methyl ester carboxylesterase
MTQVPETAGTAVLVHGGWSNPADWRFVEELLAAEGVAVSCPDLPSHRRSDGSRADDIAEVEAAIDAAAPPVVAVGWSYGGMVLSDLDLTSRDVVRLVYVASVPLPPLDGADPAPPAEMDFTHITFGDDGTWCLDDHWWVTEGEVTSCTPEVLDHLRSHPRRPQALDALLAPQTRTAWQDVPTTVLLGRTDWMWPEPARAWATEHIADVRLVDSDHFILFRAPEAIADVVLEALREPIPPQTNR